MSRDDAVRVQMARAFDAAPPEWHISIHRETPVGADVVVSGPDVDVPHAVPFDPRRPDAVVAAVVRARPSRRTVIAVTAGTGGAGATTVALHLAAALAAHRRTGVVDLDPLVGAHLRLGLDAPEGGAAAAVPVGPGFRLLRARPENPAAALHDAAGAFEAVVVDVPHGHAGVEEAIAASDAAVLVVAPTPVGVRRSSALLQRCPAPRWAIVVNRVGPGGETTVADVQRGLGHRVAIELPCCPALRDAEDDDRLLTSGWSRWTRRMGMLAGALGRA